MLLTPTRTLLFLALVSISLGLKGQGSSCMPPSDFEVASWLQGGVGFTWDDQSGSGQYEIKWDEATRGVNQMRFTTSSIAGREFVLANLSSGLQYSAYIRSICGSGRSSWVGPLIFSPLSLCANNTVVPALSDTLCTPGSAELNANSNLIWVFAGKPVKYGNRYQTDTITQNLTFWQLPADPVGPSQSAAPSVSNSAGSYGNFTNGQYITVFDTLLIDSVTLKADGAVRGRVLLWDEFQSEILQQSEEFEFSQQGNIRHPLQFAVYPGRYFINVDMYPGTGRMFRGTFPTEYPYVLPGLMQIDSTNVGPINRYYYLFDLSVRPLCTGASQSYNVVSAPRGTAGPDRIDTICMADTNLRLSQLFPPHPTIGNGYWVDQRSGFRVRQGEISLRNRSAGTWLSYYFIDPGMLGCSDTSIQRLYLLDCKIGWEEENLVGLTVYPNPAREAVHVEWTENGEADIRLYNISGQLVLHQHVTEPITLSLSDIPAGSYTLQWTSDERSVSEVLIVQP